MNRKNRVKHNKTVRRTVPGGNITLDACELFHQIRSRLKPGTEEWKIAGMALDRLNDIADAMREAVAKQNEAAPDREPPRTRDQS